jgi:hypothetical protein
MDEALQFPLPTTTERKAIIALYLEQYITEASSATGSIWSRISAFFRGQKSSADRIRCPAALTQSKRLQVLGFTDAAEAHSCRLPRCHGPAYPRKNCRVLSVCPCHSLSAWRQLSLYTLQEHVPSTRWHHSLVLCGVLVLCTVPVLFAIR